jgi:apolipoprotein N-acyltransferase
VFFARASLALASGALLSLAFPQVGVWPLALALAPLILLTVNSFRAQDAFWPGFFFGLGFFALHLLWLPQSFAPYSGGFFWLLYPPLLAVLGVFWGIVTFVARFLGGRGVGALWLLPALWVIMEWARTQGVFAFPWGVLGYIWVGTPLAQAADVAGVYGLSLLTLAVVSMGVSPLVYHPFARFTPRLAWFCALLVVASWLGYGVFRLRMVTLSAPETAMLVQGSTDPYERVTEAGGELGLYRRLTQQALRNIPEPADLVVWPEGVALELLYAGYDLTSPAAAPDRARIQRSAGEQPVITGGGAIDERSVFSASNSVFGLENAQITGRYDKVYLVPFGEYFPLVQTLAPLYRTVFGWFGYPLLQSRPPGREVAPLTVAGTQVAAYICYESVFPQIARTMTARGAQVLVNISNDAWFGFGQGARQHFEMGTLRAVETRRYLLRAGNNGITALVDPLGRTRAELPRGERGALTVRYGERSGITPYVRFGDLLIIWLVLYVVAVVALRRRILGGVAFS